MAKIAFMFLGGLPSNPEVASVWEQCISESQSIKSGLIDIVVHPQDLTNFRVGKWATLIPSKQLLVVDDDHHLKTSWATGSLVEATLLMMQYVRLRNPKTSIKKYVLLSSACCPIYGLDAIYTELTRDSKSWLYGGGEDVRDHTPLALDSSGGLFDIEHVNYYSQWMAVDARHADSLFLRGGNPTYLVQRGTDGLKRDFCNGRTNSVYVRDFDRNDDAATLQRALDSWTGGFDRRDFFDQQGRPVLQPCGAIDEHYFGAMLMRYALQNADTPDEKLQAIADNFKFMTGTDIESRLQNFYVHLVDRFKEVKLPDLRQMAVGSNHEHETVGNAIPVWTGQQFALNKWNHKSKVMPLCTASHDSVELVLTGPREIQSRRSRCCNNDKSNCKDELYNANCAHHLGRQLGIDTYGHIISSCYTDWSTVAVDPENVLRDFGLESIPKLQTETLLWRQRFTGGARLKNFLSLPTQAASLKYLQECDEDLVAHGQEALRTTELKWGAVLKAPTHHPCESSAWSARAMMNAWVLMSYLQPTFVKSPVHEYARNAYGVALKDQLGDQNEIISDSLSHANMVTPEVMLGAYSYGALFIRKLKEGCAIDKYIDVIRTTPYQPPQGRVPQYLMRATPKINLTGLSGPRYGGSSNPIRAIFLDIPSAMLGLPNYPLPKLPSTNLIPPSPALLQSIKSPREILPVTHDAADLADSTVMPPQASRAWERYYNSFPQIDTLHPKKRVTSLSSKLPAVTASVPYMTNAPQNLNYRMAAHAAGGSRQRRKSSFRKQKKTNTRRSMKGLKSKPRKSLSRCSRTLTNRK